MQQQDGRCAGLPCASRAAETDTVLHPPQVTPTATIRAIEGMPARRPAAPRARRMFLHARQPRAQLMRLYALRTRSDARRTSCPSRLRGGVVLACEFGKPSTAPPHDSYEHVRLAGGGGGGWAR